ncbi:MAG: hypothetical protein H6949_11780 [Zoogloeaceae bacterium]|nr:hypothetical protein [Zoogloeaceae bacterium]
MNDAPPARHHRQPTPARRHAHCGQHLADADGLGTITYTWKADGVVVGSGATYVLTEAEVGKVMTVEASYTDGHGTDEVVSSGATAAVAT